MHQKYRKWENSMKNWKEHMMKVHPDIKIVLGDLNAHIGKKECYSPAIGKNSLHEVTSDSGDRLIQFALSYSMMVDSPIFKHKNIHKATQSTPDRLT
jgi:hypothetical protein